MTFTNRWHKDGQAHPMPSIITYVLIFLVSSLSGGIPARAQSLPKNSDETRNYAQSIRRDLMRALRNTRPSNFREETVLILLRVDKDGRVLGSNLVRPSGDRYVNEAVANALSKDLSFDPFPAHMTQKHLNISVPITFHPR
ncbi:TonB family protein [Methylorubrum extorquens]|uniref:TonB family protein n=1 Tax=Methylorubrum extorquens TaxID=408 RepID=UPI003F62B607